MGQVAHIDGTHCGEDHLLYMERNKAIVFMLGLLFSLVFLDFSSSCYLAGLQCCLAQWCSRSGIPTSSSGKERLFGLNFLIIGFFPSYLLQLQCSFCLELGCVGGCSKGGSLRVISGLLFQWKACLSIGGSVRRTPRNIFIYLASGKPSTIPHNAILVYECTVRDGRWLA